MKKLFVSIIDYILVGLTGGAWLVWLIIRYLRKK